MRFGNPLFGGLFALRRLMRFSKPYPRAAAILVDELNAGSFESLPHNFYR